MTVFSTELIAKIEHELKRYETRRSAILPILTAIQDEHGYISPTQVQALEEQFDLPRVYVQEVITFYSRYRQTKPRPYQIQVCDNIVCRMFDSAKIVAQLKQRANEDDQLEVSAVPCLGVCDGATAILINDSRYLKVSPANVTDIVNKHIEKH